MKTITLFILFLLFSFVGLSQNIPTTPYTQRSAKSINNLGNSIGKTSYQIDRSANIQSVPYQNNYVNAYYYYIWFYNESVAYDGYRWKQVATYIQSIDIYSDGIFIQNYYLLITGDYYYITIWSRNPKANIKIVYSKPIPYY